ncbi:fatty acyl-AMP ligase [Microbispora sp. H10830]|uniref:fatty acyl-AMP ligase n=1 Tax=Microbispora sp. H10830 TaxID=2729109 RepID=UPI0015FFADB4|nr:fatty acyl-AMP ligase [Microbispora sp. H10830]
MTDFVTHVRARLGDDREFVFVRDDGSPARLTFAELDRRARATAVWLAARGLTDQPVLLLYPAGLDFTVAFLGCLYARVPAIPAPLPDAGAPHANRVRALMRDAGARLVLTDSAHAAELSGFSARVADPAVADPDAWTPPAMTAGTLAYLQYTSGSTSDPRGVEVSHGNLLHNLELFRLLARNTPVRRLAGWLPHYHDMGLVGLQLQALHAGADLVFMSPAAFVARPVRWLELISRYGADWTVSPDFGYAWCTRRITDEQLAGLDLSTLTMALSGAEPIRAGTLAEFERRFAPAGFRPTTWNPGYGLAECTLMVTCVPQGQGVTVRRFDPSALERHRAVPVPEGTPLVACGPVSGLDLRIVEPDGFRPLADGEIGEIWVSGPSVALGYRGRPAETRATFRADDSAQHGRWLRTGDLGFLLDGQLYVTGRIKDVIIVNGRNLYPQDLEEAAARSNPAAGRSAAFGVRRDDGGEHVVLVQEIRRGQPGDLGETADRVMDQVTREFGVPLSLMLVARGAVRQTTSGKLRRRHMRELFLSGTLTPLYAELEPALNDLPETVA